MTLPPPHESSSAPSAAGISKGVGGPVLVTGGTSTLGREVTERLLARGERVRLFARDPQKAAHLLSASAREGIEVLQGDLRAPWTLWEALQGCRAMVHCAHIGYGSVCARACAGVGVRRLVAVSSTRLHTRWPCETSRAVARGESAIASSGLDWTILRSTMIYGGRRDNNVERLIRWVRRHRWVPLVAGGKSLIQPVHVADLAELMVKALDEGRAVRRAFVVGGPEAVSYRELMEHVAQATGRRVRFVSVPGGLAVAAAGVIEKVAPGMRIGREQIRRLLEDKAFDIGEAREILGFRPRSLDDGLREKIAAMD